MKGCEDCKHYGGTTYAVDHDEYGEVRETSQCARHVLATGRCKDYEPSDKAAPAPKSLAPTETVGNAAAMREALMDIVLLTVKAGKSLSCDVACGIIASKAKHALATPPRNCDVVLIENLAKRNIADIVWAAFRETHPKAYLDVPGLLQCINWLFDKAKEAPHS